MGEWYRVVKVIKGRPYVYLQRTQRIPGRTSPRTESRYLGPVGGGVRKKRRIAGAAMALFGAEDDYGQRVDSLWNRYVNKEQKAASEAAPEKGKPAEAGQGEKSSFSVVGNGESDAATAKGSQSSSDPSAS